MGKLQGPGQGRAGRGKTRAEGWRTGSGVKTSVFRRSRQKLTNRLMMNASEAILTRNSQDASELAGRPNPRIVRAF